MTYPEVREELLAMLEADQQEIRACSKAYREAPRALSTLQLRDETSVHAAVRVQRVLTLLDKIGAPTIENIGEDGSQAISVFGLHARLSAMKKVLAAFEAAHRNNPASVYYEAIPSLTDRVLIIEGKPQRFGTQWMLGKDGKFFLPPVEDFAKMNECRAAYGLGKSRHPINLTDGVPAVAPPRPDATEHDVRSPTKEEYDEFVYGSLDE